MHAIIGNNFGGLERVAVNIIAGLDRAAFEPYLVCIGRPDFMVEEFRRLDAGLIVLGYGRGKHLGLPFHLFEIARKYEIDILHTHDFLPFFYGTSATLPLRSLARVYTEHSGILSCQGRHLKLTRFLSPFTSAMIMVSGALKKFYEDKVGVSGDELKVIYNGIEFSETCDGSGEDSLKESFGLRPGELVIGTAVRLIEQKGLKFLIEAAPKILSQVPNAKFLIVGDGRLRNELECQSRELNLEKNLLFLGYRKDVHRILRLFDVYVLPSLWEGCPLGILEAMFCGIPIVATRVGGVPEIIENGLRGILVQEGDSTQLADAVIRLLQDRQLRMDLGERGFQYVREKFSAREMVRNYELLYRSVVNRK